MTKENHDRLQALNPEAKAAYVEAKRRILEAIGALDLLENSTLSDEDKSTVLELLDDTAFLMNSEEL